MTKLKKHISMFLIALLVFSVTSNIGYANEINDKSVEQEPITYVVNEEQQVAVYLEDSQESEILYHLFKDSVFEILEQGEEYSYIQTKDEEENEVLGYILNEEIDEYAIVQDKLTEEELSDEKQEEAEEAIEPPLTEEPQENAPNEEEAVSEENTSIDSTEEQDNLTEENELTEESQTDELKQDEEQQAVPDEQEVSDEEPVKSRMLMSKALVTVQGVALKNPTNVYAESSRNSTVLKSYSQGKILKFEKSNNQWLQATVYVNGKAVTGYINSDDVDLLVEKQESSRGIVYNKNLHVYATPSKSSNVLKSYNEGHTVMYSTYSAQWNEARVYANGKWQYGFIHEDDVIPENTPQSTLNGVVKNEKLHVYSGLSKSSNVLKSYNEGKSIKYRTHTANWYEATVYVNGKATTGYIHKNDVINDDAKQETLSGIAKKRVNVYSSTSTSSSILKSYSEGSTLKYKTYTKNWYKATVYVNGKATTGYIQKDAMMDEGVTRTNYRGVATASPTKVYADVSASSNVLKSYSSGSILKYRSYTDNWYEATVYVNGKATKGYINKKDVENSKNPQQSITGTAQSEVTVYKKASTTSSVLKSYSKGSKIKYKTFTSNWHEVTVYVNGKAHTGYIKTNTMEKGLKGKVIVLDAGHGGHDPGAMGIEKDLNLNTANYLRSYLIAEGAEVIMTRSTDVYLTLAERVEISHEYNADAFISIHYNSNPDPSPHGIETYYLPSNEDERELAQLIQDGVIAETGLRDRGVKNNGNFYVIRENQNISVLVELGFLSNPNEYDTVTKAAYQQKAAKGIFNGLNQYFN
ncbi:N-acetylmuramoyl-L-alanine amidase [Cytobacillus sp. Sa5YUA1]|uniref:N-acetylmuramoyl-L-alanine amidase n=1 Tax=Cytobacillus stercorigallinarum TaxID=2762240 RepID=A0ABR8QP45_9BACI|nr:N-acetylmuramoyl-L-alanine amidase [Cytobacillus stercorigallinarum]MBD7937197.1 N-acetylmuramoyl-L-alanine amidase [Cytobacillus stercorigallinarum]